MTRSEVTVSKPRILDRVLGKKKDIRIKRDNTIIKDKETENNKRLQEFDQQRKAIEHLAKEITKEGLDGYQDFAAIGMFESGKRDVGDDIKKTDEYIRYWNNTYAWQCAYDMEEMMKKYKNYLSGFKEVKDLWKKRREEINVKELNDSANIFKVLKNNISTIAGDIQHDIQELQRSSATSQLMPDGGLGRYRENAEKRKARLEENYEALKYHNERTETLKEQISKAKNLTKEQKQEAEKQIKELSDCQRKLIGKLYKAVKEEEKYYKYINSEFGANRKLNEDTKQEIIKHAQEVQNAEKDFDSDCKELCNYEEAVANIMRSMQLESPNSVLKRLHEMRNKDSLDQINDMLEQGEVYQYIHAPAGKVVIQGIFWPMSRIEDLKPAGKDKTQFQWDTNRANLVIETYTKDGKQSERSSYLKTLANGDIESENFRLKFVTPFADGTKRPEAKLIIERKQGDEWKKEVRDINLVTLRSIRVKEVFEGGKSSVVVNVEEEVAADIRDIELSHKPMYKDGFEPEKAQRMYMIHLPSQSIIFPNGRRMSFNDFKWNALRDDGDGIGLKCRVQGPTVDLPYFSVSMAGYELQSPEMRGGIKDLNTKIHDHLSNAFALLRNALDEGDENLLERTFSRIENTISYNISQLESLKNAYRDPPKERNHRPRVQGEHIDSAMDHLPEFLERGKTVYDAKENFDKELNKEIQKIGVNDESKKKDLWDVCHLEKAFKVGLLDDPNLGAWIKGIAKKAGEAAHTIEELEGLGTAEKARIDTENTIIKDFIKAYDAYLEEKEKDNKKASDAFNTAIQGIVQREVTLQAKAEIAKSVKEYARKEENFNEEKKKFIKAQELVAVKDKKAEIVKGQKDDLIKYIKLKDLEDTTGEKTKKINKYTEKIDKNAGEAMILSKALGEDDYKQHESALKAAIAIAAQLDKYERDKEGMSLEDEEKINKSAKRAKQLSKNRGENEYQQYRSAIEEALKTAEKLVNHKNDQSGIEQGNESVVNSWITSATSDFNQTLKCIGDTAVKKILKSTKIEDKDKIENAKKKGKNEIDQYKLAIEEALKIAFMLKNTYESGQNTIKDERKDKFDKLVKDAYKEFDKALEIAERTAIKGALKEYIELEDREGVDERVKAACEKLEKAKKDANSRAQKKWNDENERGNIVARVKLNKIEADVKEKIEKKEENEGELSGSEKDAIRMRIIVGNAYEMKNKVGGGEIAIPIALKDDASYANEIREKVEKWVSGLPEVDHTRTFDGVELMQERRRLKSYAKDPSGKLDERYDHLVKQARLKQIENIIDTHPNVHYSYRVMLNMARAYEAALEDNYFWALDENKAKVDGVLHYLKNVKVEVEDHDGELGKLRADFLHKVVEFVRSNIGEAKDRQSIRMLLPFVVRAQRVLEADLDNLGLVKQFLNSQTSGEAKKIKDKLNDRLSTENQRSALGLDVVEGTQKKVARDMAKEIEDRLMKNGNFDFGELEKLRPSERQVLSNARLEQFRERAVAEFDRILDGLNSEQRAIMEKERPKFLLDLMKMGEKEFERIEKMSFQLYKIKEFKKEVDRQRWQDAIYMWFLNFAQNGMQAYNRGSNIFVQQIEKIIKESVQ